MARVPPTRELAHQQPRPLRVIAVLLTNSLPLRLLHLLLQIRLGIAARLVEEVPFLC
jgi:hypothetical protein